MIRVLQSAGPALKIILGALLLIICASMVITLIPGGLGSSFGIGSPGKGIVATIGDEQVTTADVQRDAKRAIRQQFPRGGEQAAMLMPLFAGQAAQQLITKEVLVVEARRLGLRVDDDELRDFMQHGPMAAALFPEGKYVGDSEYENLVNRNFDITIPEFEELVKKEILVDKLRSLVSGAAFVSDAEVRAEFDRRSTKVKFAYAVLSQADILKGLHPTDPELKAFYERNKATYTSPEKRQIKYAMVHSVKPEDVSVKPQELQAYYDQHRDEYRQPERVKVRHILIKTPLPGPDGKVDLNAMNQARKKAEDVLKQIKAGAAFEEMAKKYSDDPSAKDGGLVDFIEPNRFPSPEVQKAATSLPKGGMSDVINAGYAFVILRVEDRQPAHVKLLAEVKDEIEGKVREQKATLATEGAANTLANQARADGLDKAAQAKAVPVVTTSFFSRAESLPGIGAPPELMDAVFGETEKSPAEMIQVPQGYVLFELLSIKAPATLTFDEARASVETQFKTERASLLLQQKTQELSDRAKAEHDLKKAAKELGATMKTSELVLPDGQVPDIGSMSGAASSIFPLNPGEISGPIHTGANGAVAQLLEKQAPTEQDYAAKKDQIRQALLDAKQNEIFQVFASNVRKEMEKSKKLRINQEELNNLTRRGGEEGY